MYNLLMSMSRPINLAVILFSIYYVMNIFITNPQKLISQGPGLVSVLLLSLVVNGYFLCRELRTKR